MVESERVSPRRTRLSPKRPWSLDPATGHPETDSSGACGSGVWGLGSGVWGGIYPVGVMLFWACQRTKRPWSLALIVTDNQSEGCWAEIYPVGVMRFWACQRTKKPLRLGSHPDRQPERGALGWNLPRQGGVYLGLATLEKPL